MVKIIVLVWMDEMSVSAKIPQNIRESTKERAHQLSIGHLCVTYEYENANATKLSVVHQC